MISVAMTPRVADAPYDSSSSGCRSGSPPLSVMMPVPSSASRSTRRKDLICANGLRMVVELIAIRASQVTAAYRDEVGGDRPILGPKGFDEHAGLAERPLRFQNATPDGPVPLLPPV